MQAFFKSIIMYVWKSIQVYFQMYYSPKSCHILGRKCIMCKKSPCWLQCVNYSKTKSVHSRQITVHYIVHRNSVQLEGFHHQLLGTKKIRAVASFHKRPTSQTSLSGKGGLAVNWSVPIPIKQSPFPCIARPLSQKLSVLSKNWDKYLLNFCI